MIRRCVLLLVADAAAVSDGASQLGFLRLQPQVQHGVTGRMLRLCAVSILAMCLTLAAGCLSDDSVERQTTSSEQPGTTAKTTPESTLGPDAGVGLRPSMVSLRSMVEWYPYVIVGRVEEGSYLIYEEAYAGQICPFPITVLPVIVERVIHSPVPVLGEKIEVRQAAGPQKETCTCDDCGLEAPLAAGAAFLFFVHDSPLGYANDAGARFRIDSDGRIIPSGQESRYAGPAEISCVSPADVVGALGSASPNDALEALARVTVNEAVPRILAAIEEAPLPKERPRPDSEATFYPTPPPEPCGPIPSAEPTATPATTTGGWSRRYPHLRQRRYRPLPPPFPNAPLARWRSACRGEFRLEVTDAGACVVA
jgi:hypothetical protein